MPKNELIGRASVFVQWSANFFGTLRPSHDSHPVYAGDLTLSQVNTLNGMIERYVGKCSKQNIRKAEEVLK